MPTREGWGKDWTDGFMQGGLYLNGELYTVGIRHTKTPQSSTLFGIKTHANTDVLQRLYHGVEAPQRRQGFDISGQLRMFAQEQAESFRETMAVGTYFMFAPMDRAVDTFSAVSGTSYLLTRPLASSVIGSVTESDHPTIVKLDGVVDPTAANVVGQAVSALATGVLTIHYSPIYRMIVQSFEESVEKFNDLTFDFTFQEIVRT